MNLLFKVLVGIAATYGAVLTVFTAVYVIAVIRDGRDQRRRHRAEARYRAGVYAQIAYDAEFKAIVLEDARRSHPSAQDDG